MCDCQCCGASLPLPESELHKRGVSRLPATPRGCAKPLESGCRSGAQQAQVAEPFRSLVNASARRGETMKIIIDLETAALDDAASYLDLAEIKAPANYKDEAKIAAYVEAAKAEALNKAALDFDLARITADRHTG